MSREHFLRPALAAGVWGLRVERTGAVLATAIELAGSSGTRRRGLLGREGLPEGHALVLAPCQAIHTFGMRFPIDVVGVDRQGRVVTIRERIGRRRIVIAFRAFAIVELAAGASRTAEVVLGDRLLPYSTTLEFAEKRPV